MSDSALDVVARIPAELRVPIAEKLALARREEVWRRLRGGDATLWGPPGAPEIGDRLGWLTIAERMLPEVPALEAFAEEVASDGYEHVVLLGMGGSSLAPEVLRRCFGHREDRPALHVLDSTDPDAIAAVEQAIEGRRALFLVSSKSGGTIEPLSLFAHFFALRDDGRDYVAITDPGSGLEELAREHGFRRTFYGDPAIGGRYSALSPFGIVPAALAGVDVGSLLAGARGAFETLAAERDGGGDGDAREPAAAWLGAALSALAQAGRDKLTFLASPTLPGLGLWLEQLVAESTGKQHTGILPVADEPPGAVGDYGEDRVFVHLPDVHAPDEDAGTLAAALARDGQPVITVPTLGPPDLGRVFLLFELAVAAAGWGLGINPFDQPNVQQAKDATNGVLAEYESHHELPQPPLADEAALRELLLGAGPPHYVAIMAYAPPSGELDAAVAELRGAIRNATRSTTTFGYGPRFLHSTGQFHKGGPPTGRFLQVIRDPRHEEEIPGAPYDFAVLEAAQSIGDLQTLRQLGLPAERVRLEGGDDAAALRSLTAIVEGGA